MPYPPYSHFAVFYAIIAPYHTGGATMQKDTNERPLILAPVGGAEQLKAALRTGADAVYLGAKGFNARRNAENFGETSLDDAVRECHERGVKVFVTLNTLVTDEEFPALTEELDEIASARADAVIVQDLGVMNLIKSRYPALPVYASTQTTVHNAEGAVLLEKLGFKQVVLARELSAKEIKDIQAASPIQIECFIHGAHCMCMSGACYLSAMIGGRSGNRGLCAQPCRLNFKLGKKERALSLKDMCLIGHMDELMESGIHALKIEGRMKRPEYVAAAVTACRQAENGEKPDIDTLRAVFSRSGFTDGYYTGHRTSDMFGARSKEDVQAAASVLPRLAALYANEKQTVPLYAKLTAHIGQESRLYITDGVFEAEATGPAAESALNRPLGEDAAAKAISQTGGTIYYINQIEFDMDAGAILPLSALKAMRREAVAKIAELRAYREPYENTFAEAEELDAHPANEKTALRMRFESYDQLFDIPEAEAIILGVDEILSHPELISSLGDRLFAELPALCFPDDMPRLRQKLEKLKGLGLTHVTADNLGQVKLALDMGFSVHGDSSLNILNSQTLEQFRKMGLTDATVSFELKMNRIQKLRGTLPRGIIGYGYLGLMKMRACPARGENGCGACTGKNVLIDEKKERFTLLCRGRKYSELLNSVPLYIADKPHSGLDFITLRFTTETKSEAMRVANMFLSASAPDFPRTGGLYYRELR